MRKRGKEEASESDEEEEEEEGEDEEEPLWTGEGDPLHGEAWTEEEDAWVSAGKGLALRLEFVEVSRLALCMCCSVLSYCS